MTDQQEKQPYNQEQHIKLHLLNSLARSQRALTQILESVADISSSSKETAQRLADHIDIVAKYQRQLTAKITGISMKRRVRAQGVNGKPWLNGAYSIVNKKQEDERR